MRNEETEEKLCRVAQTKAISPKRELGPPISPKRRRISPKRELVQWRSSFAATLAQARFEAANLA